MKNINILSAEPLVELTDSHIQMLQLSDEDIKVGKLIPHEKVNEDDLKWLREVSLEQKERLTIIAFFPHMLLNS